MGTKHVVIVGGGFAGVGCAQQLARNHEVHVTLVDRHNYHQFQPLFYQVATSQLAPEDVGFSLGRICRTPPPVIPVLAERGGTQLKTPRAVLLVDTREQNPFHFSRFEGWFSGIEKKALKLGDYSVAGLEEVSAVERKDLSDLVHSCIVDRPVFID